MRIFLQIAPLPLLAIGAGILVWRGMKTKPDGRNNTESSSSGLEATGSGSADGGGD